MNDKTYPRVYKLSDCGGSLAVAMELDKLHAQFANWQMMAEHNGRFGSKARAAWFAYNEARAKIALPPVRYNRQRNYPGVSSEYGIKELYRRGYG